MTLKFIDLLDGDLAEQTWQMYLNNFAPLATLAIQRHVMTRPEFDQVAQDARIDKVLMLDDAGQLAGVATFTNHLNAVPLISVDYFAHRWPELYATGGIWYIGFVCINGDPAARGLFAELVGEFYRIAVAKKGIVGLDVCTHNQMKHHLPRAIELLVHRNSAGTSCAALADAQNYWLYDMDGSNQL